MGNYKRFEDLEIWKEEMEICKDVYVQLKNCKDYGLKDQMQRAAVSIRINSVVFSPRHNQIKLCFCPFGFTKTLLPISVKVTNATV